MTITASACEGMSGNMSNAPAGLSGCRPMIFITKEKKMSELIKIKLAGVEAWREYDFGGRVYRIDNPASVEFRPGGSTHRVTGADGIVHCVPAPGFQGCVLRWQGPVIA